MEFLPSKLKFWGWNLLRTCVKIIFNSEKEESLSSALFYSKKKNEIAPNKKCLLTFVKRHLLALLNASQYSLTIAQKSVDGYF